MTTVWAFRPLAALNNQTGFVECDDELAAQLIELGQAQDPRDGGTAMRYIEEAPPPAAPKETAPSEATYDDKAMTPRRRK